MSYEDRDDIASKIDHEGGIYDALEYGLTADHMPEGDDELRTAWQALVDAFKIAEKARRVVEDLLPEGW